MKAAASGAETSTTKLVQASNARPTNVRLPLRPTPVQRPNPPAAQKDPRGFQISQIKTRFSAREENAREGTTLLHFDMMPSDPDFPFEISSLKCTITLTALFPQYKPPALRVSNKEMERGYQVNVEKGFDVIWAQASSPTLLNAMKALDKQLEALLTAQKADIVRLIANAAPKATQPTTSHMVPLVKEDAHIAQQRSPATIVPHTISVSDSSTAPAPLRPSAEDKAGASMKREQETRQLEHRFSRIPSFSKTSDGLKYTIPIEPRKHESLPFSLRVVKVIKLTVPALYDLEPCSVELQGVEGDIARKVSRSFLRRAQEAPNTSLFAHVNYLAQNMHVMAAETAPVPAQLEQPKAIEPVAPVVLSAEKPVHPEGIATDKSHVKIIARPPEWAQHSEELEDDDESEEYDSDLGESSEDELSESADEEDHNASQPSGATREKGTMLSFPSLELHGIELLELVTINLSVKCERCKDTVDIKNIRNNPTGDYTGLRSESCKKCALAYSIGYRADLMHANSIRAGYLDLDGCTAADLLLSNFTPTCSDCSTPFPAPGVSSVRGDASMALCRECHRKMTFRLNDVKFLHITSSTTNIPRGLPRKKPKEVLGITAGENLPRRGRCTHYAKSHRWFRFSCCMKVFPCDKCHDAEADHANEFANRMICGFCSREQIYRPEDCGVCRAKLTGRTGNGFWEGGKGTRDRARMSKKDPRKFKRRGGGALRSKPK